MDGRCRICGDALAPDSWGIAVCTEACLDGFVDLFLAPPAAPYLAEPARA